MSSEYVRVIPVSQKHRRQTPLNPINVEYFNCKSFQAKTKSMEMTAVGPL